MRLSNENIVNHVLVPKHEILGAEAKKEVLDKYGIVKDQLPKILKEDSAVKMLGAKTGDVVKITRDSPTLGVSLYYRVVV